MNNSTLRALVDLRDRTLQKSRIAFSNRASAIERGADMADEATKELVAKWHERFDELESEADKDIARLVKDMPIVQQMTCVKGIGPLLAAKLVSMIDIERADTVSALWRYCGYAVMDGQRERPKAGEKLHYNIRLKTTLYLIGSSFVKSASPYESIYREAWDKYKNERDWAWCATCSKKVNASRNGDSEPMQVLVNHCEDPDSHRAVANRGPGKGWQTNHVHLAAMRKMNKVFLAHLWERWRALEDLPVRDLWVMEYGGHQHKLKAEDYGWPVTEVDGMVL